MSRQYADRITVRCLTEGEDAPPEQFVWRRRRYRVRAVLQRWVEVGCWWRGQDAADEEYQVWRVEAAPERQQERAGHYDLRQHRGTGGWVLDRAFD